MAEDPNPQKFMSLLLSFTGFMVILIAADNFAVLFFGYEGIFQCLTWLPLYRNYIWKAIKRYHYSILGRSVGSIII
jgi:NADH:ubiquinone oxidoreductase subunit 5 (subunit L)/multisubunit Na+/H+ antiporter MnhA subunit